MVDPGRDEEVEMHLRFALDQSGGDADVRERERAAAWLVEHADRAYGRVLEATEAEPDNERLIEILGRFERAESTPLLRAGLERGNQTAAVALGMSGDPAARKALLDGIASATPRVVVAAVDGLRARADRADCARITALVSHPDHEVRWMVVYAGAELGCFDRAALEAIARTDKDKEVRKLAGERARASRR